MRKRINAGSVAVLMHANASVKSNGEIHIGEYLKSVLLHVGGVKQPVAAFMVIHVYPTCLADRRRESGLLLAAALRLINDTGTICCLFRTA
jgi:hypothetical protein